MVVKTVKGRLKVDLTEAIKRLDIVTKGAVTTGFLGNYKSSVRGKGLEFEDYRNYDQDDDASLIDWKASVRANKLLIKEFVEERNLEVFFLVDASSSMITASTPKLKSEYAAELVASMAYTMIHAGDSVGLLLFSDDIVKEIPSGIGMEQFYIISESLVDPNNYGSGFDLNKALRHCLEKIKPMTLLIIVSDFISCGEDCDILLKMASEKFDLLGFMIRDPIDQSLPKVPGQVLVADTHTGERMIIEPKTIAEDYEYEAKREIKEIRELFKNNNSDFLKLDTTEMFVEPIIRMFAERRARWM